MDLTAWAASSSELEKPAKTSNGRCQQEKGGNGSRRSERTARKRTGELLPLDQRLSRSELDVLEDGRSVADGRGDLLGGVELQQAR